MKMLTKNTDYAIRAVIHLAKCKGEYVSSSVISMKEHIPLHYLRRILQVLIRAKILKPKEGINGGVSLEKDPSLINLFDIVRYFQGNIQLLECMYRNAPCENRLDCVLRKKINQIENSVIKEFKGITIKDLLHEKEALAETKNY